MYRLRIIAGPNGSGKTTLTKDLQENYHLNFGYYVNADEIEHTLKTERKISFNLYNLDISFEIFNEFFVGHSLKDNCTDVRFTISRN